MPDEQTYIDEADVYVCDNCGAFAASGKTVKHYDTYKAGESKYWEQFYNEDNSQKRKMKKDLTNA